MFMLRSHFGGIFFFVRFIISLPHNYVKIGIKKDVNRLLTVTYNCFLFAGFGFINNCLTIVHEQFNCMVTAVQLLQSITRHFAETLAQSSATVMMVDKLFVHNQSIKLILEKDFSSTLFQSNWPPRLKLISNGFVPGWEFNNLHRLFFAMVLLKPPFEERLLARNSGSLDISYSSKIHCILVKPIGLINVVG